MRSVPFQNVLNGLAQAAGLQIPRDLSPARAQTFAEYLNKRLETCWKFADWPEWTPCEQRLFRAAYDPAVAYPGPTASAAVEVFFPATVGYYQALQANTNLPPAVLVNGTWQVDGAHWALSWQNYGQPLAFCWQGNGTTQPSGVTINDWQPNTFYAGGAIGVAGTQVRNPGDNRFYQCFTAHTSGANFDGTKFGLLTAFDKYISLDQPGLTPIGQVKRVCRRDPYVFPKTPGTLEFRISNRGIQLRQEAPGVVYVEYRRRPPVFTNAIWSKTVNYAAGLAGTAQVLSAVDGNGYYATAPNMNLEPSANLGSWAVVEFPEILANPVKRLALADTYRDQKQNDRAKQEEEDARETLQDVWDEEVASQGQWETAGAVTYGR